MRFAPDHCVRQAKVTRVVSEHETVVHGHPHTVVRVEEERREPREVVV
jgi:hypothetical protein